MKKACSILLTIVMLFALAACGQTAASPAAEPTARAESTPQPAQEAPAPTEAPAEAAAETNADGKTLVVYFSWSPSGNTEKLANTIAVHTHADVLRLEPAAAYPTDYTECADVAKAERDENARPGIANLPETLEDYDTVFVGYPIWWHTAPMIIGTFLESYDLTGKEIYPFSQSASMNEEQFDNSMDFVRTSAAGANVHDGLFVAASDSESVLAYLTDNGFSEE